MTLINVASIASLVAIGIATVGFVVTLFATVREMRNGKKWWVY